LAAIPLSVVASVAGAYLWGIYEILRQYWSAELSSVGLHFVWLRLLIAALGGLSEAALKETVGALAAFGLGVFPLRTLQDYVREQAKNRLQIGTDTERGRCLRSRCCGGCPPT
jgi:hypothetical protein